MILPSSEYHSTNIIRSPDLYKGADALLYSVIGAYQRRYQFGKSLLQESEKIYAQASSLKHTSDGSIGREMEKVRRHFRRNRDVPWQVVKEAMVLLVEKGARELGMRAYPVQIMGALILYRGCLAEMATGEGKTLTACFPAILNAWTRNPCHVVTVNEYLAGRDASEMMPFYRGCGVSVGSVNSKMDPESRRENYRKGVVYTTCKELTADFLRDRLLLGELHNSSRRLLRRVISSRRTQTDGLVLNGLYAVIVDEADSVLIDEAVTPLIISRAKENKPLVDACLTAKGIADTLHFETDYLVDQQYREIQLTKQGYSKVASLSSNLTGLWQGEWRRVELIEQALTAREFYIKDMQYVIQDETIVIVDEFTGRLMENRSWRQGLHQAVEAKEGVEISNPSETLSRLSFQRFFKFFSKLSGMTGTAYEARAEFWSIYGLNVQRVPTNKPCLRKMLPDRVFPKAKEKWENIYQSISEVHATTRPILIGTKNLNDSETLAKVLSQKGYTFNLLNAVHHRDEAAIIARAGEPLSITIATNMAGRGTDIKLGKGVAKNGGLHVLATERNESGRIDRQLFGRCARQGDPGSAQSFSCPDDEIIRRFLPEKMRNVLIAALEREKPGVKKLGEQVIKSSQKSAQRQAYKQRKQVLGMDTWLDEALSFTGSKLDF